MPWWLLPMASILAIFAIFAIFAFRIPHFWSKMDYFSSKGRYPNFFLTFSTHNQPPDSRVPKGISKINPVWPPLNIDLPNFSFCFSWNISAIASQLLLCLISPVWECLLKFKGYLRPLIPFFTYFLQSTEKQRRIQICSQNCIFQILKLFPKKWFEGSILGSFMTFDPHFAPLTIKKCKKEK